MSCQCQHPGFCERHHLVMTPTQHARCQAGTFRDRQKPAESPPRLVEMGLSFMVIAARHAAGGFKLVPLKLAEERHALCKSCEHYDAAKDQCNVCGCPLKRKTTWAVARCPLKQPKWGEWKAGEFAEPAARPTAKPPENA
jgi:hypothetical protein